MLDVDDRVEEVCFAMLTAEVLQASRDRSASVTESRTRGAGVGRALSYPAYDLVVVCQVCLAGLAPVYTLGVEVDVVGEAHLDR